ncbi:MAG: 50S ribosomal protein L10 [Clostridia bacterium]
MSANIEIKKQIVEEIKEKIAKAKSIVLVNNNGLNVAQDTELRAAARKENVEYKVYKNRLMNRAFTESGITGLESFFEGTTAIAFGYEDETGAPRVVNDFAKKTQKLEIKAGVNNGVVADKAEMIKLASIPSKEVLIATLLRTLNNPVASLARALDAIASKN